MNNFSTLEEAYLQGLANGITQAHLILTMEKTRDRQCSRRNCPLQRTINENDFNDDKCRKHCEWYTPKITKEDIINILETLLKFIKNQKGEDESGNAEMELSK